MQNTNEQKPALVSSGEALDLAKKSTDDKVIAIKASNSGVLDITANEALELFNTDAENHILVIVVEEEFTEEHFENIKDRLSMIDSYETIFVCPKSEEDIVDKHINFDEVVMDKVILATVDQFYFYMHKWPRKNHFIEKEPPNNWKERMKSLTKTKI